jgi:hypothetical protein
MMRRLATVSCRPGSKFFSYFFRFRSLFNSRGPDDIKERPSPSTGRKGDGCMKDTDHHIRHSCGHLGDRASPQRRESCARQKGQTGRGMAPSRAGATPLLHTVPCAKVTRGSLQPNKKLPSVRAARIWSKQLKQVGITHFSFVFSIFFSFGREEVSRKRGNKRHENEKSDTEKNTRLGGRTPLFRLSAAQKVR